MFKQLAPMIAAPAGKVALCGALAALVLMASGGAPAPAAQPGYRWHNVQIVAGGFVSGIVAHPAEPGLFYARTDIGGAYRYDDAARRWIALNDWTTPADWHHMGIEALALDPSDASMLYLVAGMYTQDWDGNAAVLVSADQGAHFRRYQLPFRAGGNNDGRNAGERLQVDPNDGSVLLYGTMNDAAQGASNGIWKSRDRGVHWTRQSRFKALPNDGSGAGVAFIAFDPTSGGAGRPSATVFAGASCTPCAAAGTTLHKSSDGGQTWSAVKGGPAGQMPNHGQIGADRNLYISYGDASGPNGMSSGQVWKYHIDHDRWHDITPPNPHHYRFGYGGLALDRNAPGTLVVTTMDRWHPGDTMLRSTDGGASWADIGTSATRDASASPWVKFGKPDAAFGNWAQVVIDPFDSAHALYATGQTIWTTDNLSAAERGQPGHWRIGAAGIEETAVLALMSPSAGVPLVSGVGDICGFVHADLTRSPAAGMVSNPICANGTGLDYAKARPARMVRVGTGGPVFGAVSSDGGTSWTPFARQAGSREGDGTVAMSADGATIVWAPKDAAPAWSGDDGTSWRATGLAARPSWQILSDGADANRFYAYDQADGAFHTSVDQGRHWQRAGALLPRGGKAAAVAGLAGELWLASPAGLLRSSDGGARWRAMPAVASAISVGFGKAARGATYPAIYLAGTVNGVTALFRSTDAARSWLRINDSDHQWGGYSLVAGDPKTFGTVYVAPNSGRGIMVGSAPD